MGKKTVKKITTVTEEIITTNEKTHIHCVLDRSGSMSSIIDDSIGGFNTFLEEQKKLPDEATISIALFDHEYEMHVEMIDIKKVKNITREDWKPRGTTALYDAIGKSINELKTKFAKLGDEKPDKVLVCVVTDGFENSSKEMTADAVKTLINECETKDGWAFVYLAANQDAFAVGSSLGFSGGNTFTYIATADGVTNMSQKVNSLTSSYRSLSVDDANYLTKKDNLIDNDDDK